MKTWRPDNWKNEYDCSTCDSEDCPGCGPNAFEAGADAMLEALKNKGSIMSPEQMKLIVPDRKYPFGWLVFIPDEENSVVVGGWKGNEEICTKCYQNRRALLEMLLDKDNKGNRVTAHTAIENCVACKRAFHQIIATNFMRRTK